MTRLLAAALLALSLPAFAGDSTWPRFRGPAGAGVADGEKPPVEFGPGKNVLWQVATPSGPSSPCIWKERIFLTAFDGGKLWTLCLDRATGQELWRRDAGAEKIEAFLDKHGSPAASTPATDGERVIVYFGSCGLLAYDFAGKELWRHALPRAETNNDFGSGTSPVLADGLVILVRDLMKDSAILALDAATGRQVWKTARPLMATGYSTPIIWEHDGVKELIAPGGLMMKAYDLTSGAERWLLRELPAVNCSSPIASGGLLYFAGWSPAGEDAPMPTFAQLLGPDPDKDGRLSRAEAQDTPLKDFFSGNDTDKDGFVTAAEWDGMIGYLKKGKNRLVAVKPGGSGDITESHVAWQKTKGLPYVPSPLLYREKLFLITLDGKAATLAADDQAKIVARAAFGEAIAATPAIVDDTLYVRTATKLYAFKEPK